MKKIFLICIFLLINNVYAIPQGWKYSHLGVPTKEHSKDELYDKKYKYYTWGYEKSEYQIQMHRFEDDAPFPEIIKKYPHIAFQVPNLKKAIQGRKVVWGPIESKPGLFVAMIEDPATGMPVELLETKLTLKGMKKLHQLLEKKN